MITNMNKVEGHKELSSGEFKADSGDRSVSVNREKWVGVQGLSFPPGNGMQSPGEGNSILSQQGQRLHPKLH